MAHGRSLSQFHWIGMTKMLLKGSQNRRSSIYALRLLMIKRFVFKEVYISLSLKVVLMKTDKDFAACVRSNHSDQPALMHGVIKIYPAARTANRGIPKIGICL